MRRAAQDDSPPEVLGRSADSYMPSPTSEQTRRRSRFGLIADDLTGACDAGVQFAQRGFSTLVRIAAGAPGAQAFDLLAVMTNSRNDDPTTAATKVRNACRALRDEGRELMYKKIDSTLRGNLGAELQAAMDAGGFALALVAPAFPAMGRTVEAGTLRVTASTSYGPVHLPSLLERQGVKRVVHLDRATWAPGAIALSEQLRPLPDKTIAALDSINEDDLETIAHAGAELAGRALLAGSAGLAAATARILAERLGKSTPSEFAAPTRSEKRGPVVLILGSVHPATQAQMDFLVRSKRVTHIKLDEGARQKAQKAMNQGQSILVTTSQQLDSDRLLRFLPVFDSQAARGVALSGGDTAFAILSALGASGIKLVGEVLPGIPHGHIMGGLASGLPVVTKAGGFGNEDALAVVVDFLAV